jgi:valyl-tRNA synthetase
MIEAEVEAVLELIRGIRNARSEAHLEPGAWLAAEVVVPAALGATFEALRPAIERLARVRPLDRRLTREALTTGPGSLTVIAGDLEATVHPAITEADPAAAALERARLERDLAEATGWLDAARLRLADERFVTKAPPAIVEQARAREAELADQVARLTERLRG